MYKKIALCGWFSLEKGQATSGDILCLNEVSSWLKQWKFEFEIIYAKKVGGRGYKDYNRDFFATQIFICGPIDGKYEVQKELFDWFLGSWYFWSNSIINRIDSMHSQNSIIRDGIEPIYPDFSFLQPTLNVPFVITIFRDAQKEYGVNNCLHNTVSSIVNNVLNEGNYFHETISTELNCSWQEMLMKSMAIEKFISCADLVITTRLHGLIHSLRSGRMAIAIDQIRDGAKLATLCNQIEYPYFILAEDLTKEWLKESIEKILHKSESNKSSIYLDISLTKLKEIKELAYKQLSTTKA